MTKVSKVYRLSRTGESNRLRDEPLRLASPSWPPGARLDRLSGWSGSRPGQGLLGRLVERGDHVETDLQRASRRC